MQIGQTGAFFLSYFLFSKIHRQNKKYGKGVEVDWPLEVIGFDGKRFEIVLKPGELALYEGHALIHGRPRRFNGTLFSNAFCHFKPKGNQLFFFFCLFF